MRKLSRKWREFSHKESHNDAPKKGVMKSQNERQRKRNSQKQKQRGGRWELDDWRKRNDDQPKVSLVFKYKNENKRKLMFDQSFWTSLYDFNVSSSWFQCECQIIIRITHRSKIKIWFTKWKIKKKKIKV